MGVARNFCVGGLYPPAGDGCKPQWGPGAKIKKFVSQLGQIH